jgi:hypothetical protein
VDTSEIITFLVGILVGYGLKAYIDLQFKRRPKK